MPGLPIVSSVITADSSVLQGAVTAGITVVVVVLALLGFGLVLLFRRRDGAKPSSASGLDALTTSANVQLVRVDQSLAAADDELGFAVAQFGETATAEFATALAGARAKVTQAFRLKQQLDDAIPESLQKRREWTLQIIALCEAASAALDAQDHDFSKLRSDEANAPASIASLRTRIGAASARLETVSATWDRLREKFDPTLSAAYATSVADARAALASATESSNAAEGGVSPAGVNAVAADLAAAEQSLHRAVGLLDGVDGAASRVDEAARALDALVLSTAADLAEARAERETAPDPQSGAEIIDAIDDIERELVTVRANGQLNPVLALDSLGAAVASLDTALASARNQQQRLEHARAALAGALVSAKSQLAAVRDFASGRRLSADARTRIAEAERELEVAESAADPVEALDAARRAVTHARDADALARYSSR